MLFEPLLLGLVENDGTPVSTRVDTDTGVGSVSDSSDMAVDGWAPEEAKKKRIKLFVASRKKYNRKLGSKLIVQIPSFMTQPRVTTIVLQKR